MQNFGDYKNKEQQKLDSQMRDLNLQAGKLENTLAKQLHDNELKASELASAKKDIESLLQKRDRVESDSGKIKQANNDLNQNFKKYTKECELQRKAMEDELVNKNGKMNNLKGLCRQKQLDASTLTDETATVKKLINIQDSAMSHLNSEFQGLVEEHNSETEKVNKLQSEINSQEELNQTLLARKLEMQNAHEHLTLQRSATHGRITELQLQIVELNQHYDTIKSQTNVQIASNKDQQKILDSVTADADMACKQIKELENQQSKLQSIFDGLQENYTSNLNELKALMVTIGKFEVSESSDMLDGYPALLDKSQNMLKLNTLDSLNITDAFRTTLE
mmetsp:Transcript_11861/g.25907  ORF Transcript_11861/g.25907 Transcript_11861/m.25907 type:complete len:335 (-) Transcript_11861:619-1623(-)